MFLRCGLLFSQTHTIIQIKRVKWIGVMKAADTIWTLNIECIFGLCAIEFFPVCWIRFNDEFIWPFTILINGYCLSTATSVCVCVIDAATFVRVWVHEPTWMNIFIDLDNKCIIKTRAPIQ